MAYDFTLKDGVSRVYSDEMFYDFFLGGYINEHELLKDKGTRDAVTEARLLIEEFLFSVVEEEE